MADLYRLWMLRLQSFVATTPRSPRHPGSAGRR